jgi:arsenate reductase
MTRPVFHGIASCDSCRKARKWLDAHEVDYRVHDLREDGLDIQMLERWANRADWQQLLNTRSLTWRRLPEVDRMNVTRDRALALMLDHPTLVKRPILEHGKSIVVGFSPEGYEEILRKL